MDRKAEIRDAALQHKGRALHVYLDEDGTVTVRGRLAPEVGALLIRALDAAREALYQRTRVRATEAADVSAETSAPGSAASVTSPLENLSGAGRPLRKEPPTPGNSPISGSPG